MDSPSPQEYRNVPSLVIDIRGGRLEAWARLDGERVLLPTFRLPAPFRPFTSPFFAGTADSVREDLKRYLLAHGNAWPLFLRYGEDEERPLRWEGYLPGETRVEFDLRGDRVLVRHVPGGREGVAVVCGGFSFDTAEGTFGLMPKDAGWKGWRTVRALLAERGIEPLEEDRPGKGAVFPAERFRQAVLSFEGDATESWLRTAVFRVDGERVVPAEGPPPSFLLSIVPAPGNRDEYLMRAEGRSGNMPFPPSEPFRVFTRDAFPRLLAPQRFGETVAEAFFLGIRTESDRERGAVVREAIAAAGRELNHTREAARIVAHHAERCRARETRLLLSDDGRWLLCDADRMRQAWMYEVPYRLFGPAIFYGGETSGGDMRIARKELPGRLHRLFAGLREQGIGLSLEERDVLPASWEVTVDATRNRIDWFEVRPEIRVDGELLPDAAWGEGLAQDGFLFKDGAFRVLDPGTYEALSDLSRAARKSAREGAREFVRMPRLQILDLIRWRRHGVRVLVSPEEERILSRLAGLAQIEPRPLPCGAAGVLRPYQAYGYSWLAFLYENRFGACLADDMGLGKTVQAIMLLAALQEGIVNSRAPGGTPSLVVMPPGLLFNWENEIRKFYPSMRVRVYRGKDRVPDFEGTDVVLTTYDIVRRDVETLAPVRFDAIVFDEAQSVKNLFSKSTGAVRRLRGCFTLTLTGTPVENRLGEFYSILDLAVPGLLGEYEGVRGKLRRETPEFVEEVRRRCRPFVLRRSKDTILSELPPKAEIDVFLELSERQRALYRRTAEEVRAAIDVAYRTRSEAQARVIALTSILRLRQICLAPSLLLPSAREVSPKVAYLSEKLAELREEGHSVLVFSQFTTFLDLVEKALADAGMEAFRLDGNTPVRERKRIVEAYQRGEGPPVFLLSLKAGGTGLTLTRATYVFHLDPWWNPAVENQATDRAHRIGQERRVTVMRLLMRHTVEEKMMELKSRKAALYRALLGGEGLRGNVAVTRADFEALLSG